MEKFRDSIDGNNDVRQQSLHVGKCIYVITVIKNIPDDVLDDIMSSDEYGWGDIWLFRTKDGQAPIDDIKQVVQNSDFQEAMPTIDSELLVCNSDGNELYWINPAGTSMKLFG